MRSINIAQDIEAILTQYARCIPDLFAEFDLAEIEVVHNFGMVYDIVRRLDDDNEVVLGEITISDSFEAFFDIFEADELLLEDEVG